MKTLDRILVDLSYECDDLREALEAMTRDRDEWREKFINQTLADIKHGDTMMAGLLAVAIRGVNPQPAETSD